MSYQFVLMKKHKNNKPVRTVDQELEDFKLKYEKKCTPEDGGCISWEGSRMKKVAWFRKRNTSVHRMIGHAFMGLPLDAGYSIYVCHKCDVPWCINLEHLFLGTPSENQLDCTAKNRRGSKKGPISPYWRQIPSKRGPQ